MNTIFSNNFRGMKLFCRAFSRTKHEMWISMQILLVVTLCFAVVMFAAEHSVNPEFSFFDALVWTFVKYVEDPADIVDSPITIVGQIVGTMVGVLGIAIFAVPAGLIGSGFMDAMAEEKAEQELEENRQTVARSFRLLSNRNIKLFIDNKLPKDTAAWYHGVQFRYIPNNISLAKLQLKGLEFKDVMAICKRYPEYRIKNEASARSADTGDKKDRYMLEHFPVNRIYGCMINRGSKVTIVSTSSRSEIATGNISYYLAKYAGFNYISKEFDADTDDSESYYNNKWDEVEVDGKTLSQRQEANEKISKEVLNLYSRKEELREAFVQDLETLAKGEDTWVICILSQIPTQLDTVDFHFASTAKDGVMPTVNDMETYQQLRTGVAAILQTELQLSAEETTRFPLLYKKGGQRNLLYKLQEDGCLCNGFTIRMSSVFMNFDSRMRLGLFLMAKEMKDVLAPDARLLPEEIEDMNRTGYGFSPKEQRIDELRPEIKF